MARGDTLLEPFFNFDEDSGLFSLALVSQDDHRCVTLRMDEHTAVEFYHKFRHFLLGVRAVGREEL